MDETTRRKIRNRIAMKFRRKAKELGRPKDWKLIIVNGKTFEQSFLEELENFDPNKEVLTAEQAIEVFRQGIMGDKDEKPLPSKDEGGTEYTIDPQVLRMWNRTSEQEHAREMKAVEKQINEELASARIPVCRRCRCNPCLCRD